MALQDARDQVDGAFARDARRGLAFENAFGGATSAFRRTYTKDLTGYDLAITGVPFDQAVTHRPGTRFGPRAIRHITGIIRHWMSSPWRIMATWASIMPRSPTFQPPCATM